MREAVGLRRAGWEPKGAGSRLAPAPRLSKVTWPVGAGLGGRFSQELLCSNLGSGGGGRELGERMEVLRARSRDSAQ